MPCRWQPVNHEHRENWIVESGVEAEVRPEQGETFMKEYEVADLFEVGDAGEIIQTPKQAMIDEVAGSDGPNQYSLEDE